MEKSINILNLKLIGNSIIAESHLPTTDNLNQAYPIRSPRAARNSGQL